MKLIIALLLSFASSPALADIPCTGSQLSAIHASLGHRPLLANAGYGFCQPDTCLPNFEKVNGKCSAAPIATWFSKSQSVTEANLILSLRAQLNHASLTAIDSDVSTTLSSASTDDFTLLTQKAHFAPGSTLSDIIQLQMHSKVGHQANRTITLSLGSGDNQSMSVTVIDNEPEDVHYSISSASVNAGSDASVDVSFNSALSRIFPTSVELKLSTGQVVRGIVPATRNHVTLTVPGTYLTHSGQVIGLTLQKPQNLTLSQPASVTVNAAQSSLAPMELLLSQDMYGSIQFSFAIRLPTSSGDLPSSIEVFDDALCANSRGSFDLTSYTPSTSTQDGISSWEYLIGTNYYGFNVGDSLYANLSTVNGSAGSCSQLPVNQKVATTPTYDIHIASITGSVQLNSSTGFYDDHFAVAVQASDSVRPSIIKVYFNDPYCSGTFSDAYGGFDQYSGVENSGQVSYPDVTFQDNNDLGGKTVYIKLVDASGQKSSACQSLNVAPKPEPQPSLSTMLFDFGDGNQTAYIIHTATDLLNLGQFPKSPFVLDADIDAASVSPAQNYLVQDFQGKFDGQGHTISNLNVMIAEDTHGPIKNVTLDGGSVQVDPNRGFVGGLVGRNYSQISQVTVSNKSIVGSLTGDQSEVGGIIAYNMASLSNAKSVALTVKGYHAAGLVDESFGPVSDSSVEQSTIQGDIIAGGVMTYLEDGGSITNVHSVSNAVSANYVAGGFLGVGRSTAGLISNSSISGGSVTANSNANSFNAARNGQSISNSFSSSVLVNGVSESLNFP